MIYCTLNSDHHEGAKTGDVCACRFCGQWLLLDDQLQFVVMKPLLRALLKAGRPVIYWALARTARRSMIERLRPTNWNDVVGPIVELPDATTEQMAHLQPLRPPAWAAIENS